MKCEICNKEIFKNHFKFHIKKYHNMESYDYYKKYVDSSFHKCENLNCNNEAKFISISCGFRRYCSSSCANQISTSIRHLSEKCFNQEKQKQTKLKKYGNKCNLHTEEGIKKKKATWKNKYGVEYPTQSDIIKEKTKETNLKRYGGSGFKSDIIKTKIEETNIQKYGKENPFQSDVVKEKIKQTNLERYGVEYPTQSDIIKEKTKETNLKLYNGIGFGSNIIKEKITETCLKKYGTTYFPISNISNEEKELFEYIKSIYNGNIITNNRDILKGIELDIYLPELKIAFEYNGLYWHSIDFKDENYHLNKTIECEKQDIQLVHIFENEWLNYKEDIKDYIKKLLFFDNTLIENKFIFKKENNNIIVDRRFNNGKVLEKYGYILTEEIIPNIENISFYGKIYKIYNCGYLKYKL